MELTINKATLERTWMGIRLPILMKKIIFIKNRLD